MPWEAGVFAALAANTQALPELQANGWKLQRERPRSAGSYQEYGL